MVLLQQVYITATGKQKINNSLAPKLKVNYIVWYVCISRQRNITGQKKCLYLLLALLIQFAQLFATWQVKLRRARGEKKTLRK